MKTVADPQGALADGLAAIRTDFQVPTGFPPEVLEAAEAAVERSFGAHRDRTAIPFVTLDPAEASDLDQAFWIEAAGADLLLRYAIADVGWFVDPDGALDAEAWRRGATLYLPDGKAPLYPTILSERAASLLPDGERPAVLFHVRLDPDGQARLDGVERALIRSRAKLGYEHARTDTLPPLLPKFAARVAAAEAARGASRVDPPEQEVTRAADGDLVLAFRPRRPVEDQNARLSLACNLAIAEALLAHRTGLFRVMPEPDARAVARLRHTAAALGLAWPEEQPLDRFERGLRADHPREAAMMAAIRRAGRGARYQAYAPDTPPWHAAVAAPYAHATAPLRRLADRYVVEAALAVVNGRAVPDWVEAGFARLPETMARADSLAGRIDRAVIDLAESVLLRAHVGEVFAAVVTEADDAGSRIQLIDHPVMARLGGQRLAPGDRVRVRLREADPARRVLAFALEPAA
jgi:exoribonuclease R